MFTGCSGEARAESIHESDQPAEGLGRVDARPRYFVRNTPAISVGPLPRHPQGGAVGQANDEQSLALLDEDVELSAAEGVMPARDRHALWRITKDIRSL